MAGSSSSALSLLKSPLFVKLRKSSAAILGMLAVVRTVAVSSFLSELQYFEPQQYAFQRLLLRVPPVAEALFWTPKYVAKGRFPPADADPQINLVGIERDVSCGPAVWDSTDFLVFFFFCHTIASITAEEEIIVLSTLCKGDN